MSSVFFEGNTYTFGATVSANPGTGTTSYVFGGLSSGSTFGFILRTFNEFGFSNFVGPSIIQTLSTIPEEQRDEFVAFAWSWLAPANGFPFGIYNNTYSTYDVSIGPNSGNNINYFVSSENPGNTNWFNAYDPISKPNWLNIISGVTDPLGGTGGYIFNAKPDISQTLILQQRIAHLQMGRTYIMSMYINVDGTTSGWSVKNELGGAYNLPGRGISMQQILPIGATASSASISPNVVFPTGTTSWQRFAWIMYLPVITDPLVLSGTTPTSGNTWDMVTSTILSRTMDAGITANIYIFGPQLELQT